MSEPCGKKYYGTMKEARVALLECWHAHRRERSVYWCTACQGYHLTKMGPGERGRFV